MVEYFAGTKEFLWFRHVEHLKELVITEPMMFVKSLRSVICHNVGDSFKGIGFDDAKQDLLQRGLLSYKDFCTIYEAKSSEDNGFSPAETWNFLIMLGISLPLTEQGENQRVLIPCLIKDITEAKITKRERKMQESPNAICVQYKFDRDQQSVRVYSKMLEKFTGAFLFGENGGEITLSFSQKVEKKRLGNVGGIQGFLKWTSNGVTPAEYNFLMIENESNPPDPTDEKQKLN